MDLLKRLFGAKKLQKKKRNYESRNKKKMNLEIFMKY